MPSARRWFSRPKPGDFAANCGLIPECDGGMVGGRKTPKGHGVPTKASPVVTVGSVKFANNLPLAVIAGPCALESREHAFEMAGALKEITQRLGIGFVYKTSFDKANRTSAASGRGMGLGQALKIFADIRSELGVSVL